MVQGDSNYPVAAQKRLALQLTFIQLSLEVDLHGKYLTVVLGALVFPQGSNTHGQRRLIQGSKGLKAEMLSLESSTILMDAFGRNKVVQQAGHSAQIAAFSLRRLGLNPRFMEQTVLKPSAMIPRCWALLTSLRHSYEPEMPPLRMLPVDVFLVLWSSGISSLCFWGALYRQKEEDQFNLHSSQGV